ncbi:MAG: PrsW family intramembrane metalloprotease, partial [Propionibacteriaceae bacterium]|nr:PrsW family intramembrane metalloprotease [Propionibacteriaceae bacterium]
MASLQVGDARLARRRNGLPFEPDRSAPLPMRILRSPLTWALFIATVVFAALLYDQYLLITSNADAVADVVPVITFTAVRQAALYALPTLAFWCLVFVLVDRFRPARPALWYIALGWGGCVATWLSLIANDWASVKLGIEQFGGDAAAQVRMAVFVAPFVEEACKATVLFWLAILARQRIVSKLSMITLGGLSAAGFAFTENVIYYCRAIVYASGTIDVGDANEAVMQTVWMRGFYTCFGHPLFTAFTGIGIAVALRTRSKVVRVLAPLVGFGAAALCHMLFNSQASLQSEEGLQLLYFLVVLPSLLGLVIALVRQELAQGRLIKARLTDYVRMGWLEQSDPVAFSRLRSRFRALLLAALRGWRPWLATYRMQRAMTELAYLRDAEARGVVDEGGDVRAQELVRAIRTWRPEAVDDPSGVKLGMPRPIRQLLARVRR